MTRLLLLIALSIGATMTSYAAQWDFDVYLDDKRIGRHTFTIEGDSHRGRIVRSDARFDVKVLMVPVYRYRHSAEERWSGTCLTSIESSTTVNGKRSALSGRRVADAFELAVTQSGDTRTTNLPACVSTYAYWDMTTLTRHDQLLNSQTGSYDFVQLSASGPGEMALRGATFVIDLQYAADRWQSLSTLRDGRRLEYRLAATDGSGSTI